VKYLLPLLLLAGCTTTLNVTPQRQQQEQNQSQTSSQTAITAADQQSSHASDSKQGTSSMPVIIICNSTNSPNAVCSPFETAKDVFQKSNPSKGEVK
jgi:uncharacterized lipoprotein YajG